MMINNIMNNKILRDKFNKNAIDRGFKGKKPAISSTAISPAYKKFIKSLNGDAPIPLGYVYNITK